MHVLMSSVKDEGPFVVEFVAHHLVLGFDRIMIASNDCRDGTDDLLAALHGAGYVQHLNQTVAVGEIPQHAGYDKLRANFGLNGVEWLMILDIDEFLHVSLGAGRVQDLTCAAPPDVDIIALNALTFGPDLSALWHPGRVCAQFTHRLGTRDRLNGSVKSLTRAPQRFRAAHNHHMVGFKGRDALKVMRGDGTVFETNPAIPLWRQIRNTPSREIRHQWAHYNHYAVKTYDSFALRRDRGRGAKAQGPDTPVRHTDDYFAAHIKAHIVDDQIAVYAAAVQAKMTEMLSHPEIQAAQSAAEARYMRLLAPYRSGLTPD
jgi:Glycosyl transferase family 2